MLVRYVNDLHLSFEIVTAVPLQNNVHYSLRNISILLSAFHNQCTITERQVFSQSDKFSTSCVNPYPRNNASWVSRDQNNLLLAFKLYPSNEVTIEIWGFLGRDWFHSYVINSDSFGFFFREFCLSFMQQQLLYPLRFFSYNNFCIYASLLSLLLSEIQSMMK